MSDDTPTERFVPPTQPQAAGPETEVAAEKPRSKGLVIALAIIGGVLLIAVVILLTLLFARGTGGVNPEPSNSALPSSHETPSPSPSVSSSPSSSPSAAPSPPPSPSSPPVTTGPVFNSFSPADNTSVGCSGDSGSKAVAFTWASTGANEAAIGVGTTDAFAGPYETGLPASGSFEMNYQCTEASQIYTVSIRGASGQTNKTVTLKR